MTDKTVPVYAAALTDAGGRRVNEDAVYACSVEADKINARGHLYIVADGTGGQQGGQTASSMAVAIVSEHYYDNGSPDIGESLHTAITTAHTALYELAQKVASWAEMSTTMVAAAIHNGTLHVAYVGDSRAYLIRNGQARLLTRDHVWLEDDENYGALVRWLGGTRHPFVEVDLLVEPLQENDVVVLCSDGLTDVVDRSDIGVLASKSAPQTVTRQLIELANRRGTGDNVSAAVIQYGGKPPASATKRWVWLGGGGALLLAAIIALAVLVGRGSNGDDEHVSPGSPTDAPDQPTVVVATLEEFIPIPETPTLPPTQVTETAESTRGPTSTPVPPTDTPTPVPTVPTSTPTPTPTPTEPVVVPTDDGGQPKPKPKPKPTSKPEPPSH